MPASPIAPGATGCGDFRPRVVVEIKALACERPADLGLPLTRLSSVEIARVAFARDIVEAISTTTVWRWLAEDALRLWRYRTWIFPRDPDFERNGSTIQHPYAGRFEDRDWRPVRASLTIVDRHYGEIVRPLNAQAQRSRPPESRPSLRSIGSDKLVAMRRGFSVRVEHFLPHLVGDRYSEVLEA